MFGTVAPGKQWVMALKKRARLIIESPTIRTVGGNSGWGEEWRLAVMDEEAEGSERRTGGEGPSLSMPERGGMDRGETEARRGAGVKCGVARRVRGRVE